MSTYRLAEAKCPCCTTPLDAATDADDRNTREPQCGDLTVCRYCAVMLQFIFGESDTLDVKKLTPDDLRRIGEEDMEALTSLLRAQYRAQHDIKMRRKDQRRWN